jgi:DNA-nicking Smr family endonuclease
MENNLEMMLSKFRMFETEEVVKSVHISGSENAKKLVFDAHGFTAKKAKKTINNLIAVNKNEFTLEVIHGYHHGTAIKDLVNDTENTVNKRVSKRKTFKENPGVTQLLIEAV